MDIAATTSGCLNCQGELPCPETGDWGLFCSGACTMEYERYAEMADRRIMCKRIADIARLRGLDADSAKVSRQYRIWLEWYRGRMLTGYLIRMTGVRKLEQP